MDGSSAERALFFPAGRDAIHHAYRSLGVGSGDCVLAPALICRSAVEPIAATGARVEFVDVGADFDYAPDLLDAAFARHRPKSLLAVHLFGRRPRLERYRDLCSRFGSFLVEDRCHSLPTRPDFSADIVGDCAVYSFRKFVPVPDGGMLVWRDPRPRASAAGADPSLAVYGRFLLRQLGKRLVYAGVCNPYAVRRWMRRPCERANAGDRHALTARALCEQPTAYAAPQSRASVFLRKWLSGERLSAVAHSHGRHYRQLAAMLPPSLVCPPPGGPSEAGVPVALPIVDFTPLADLVDRLRALGIGAYVWPGDDLPAQVRGQYPQAERLSRRVVMLPVHVELTDSDLAYMATAVASIATQWWQGPA